MQETIVFLHTHVLVVVLFLLLFAYKTVLLLLNRHEALARARRQTRMLDIIFGTLILVTGGFLLYSYQGVPAWLILKVVLVVLAIPLGIVGIRRESKVLAGASLLLFGYIYGVAETKSLTLQEPGAMQNATSAITATPETDAAETGDASLSQSAEAQQGIVAAMNEAQLSNAKAIYTHLCETCHGADGARGLGGASNLQVSNLSQNNRVHVIEKGRGLMPAFGGQLSDEEVEALATYTMTLKK
ncbi:c-type cytochrome [Pontibacter kalidii]|uniref:c-type cytochrome n=1 Tax=Pontibacter kalidii TaxID=2592049 RepID=UPI0022533C0A|nr:cytochrome c [Pontibacter kalidii]